MTSSPARPDVKGPGAGGRRARYAFQTGVLVFAVTMCCVLVGVLGERFPKYFDVTATREHELSPRTREVLRSLNGPYELVVAVNGASVDPIAAKRTLDVLDTFSRTASNLKVTVIDIASPNGVKQLDGVLTRVSDRYAPELKRVSETLADLQKQSTAMSKSLDELSAGLLKAQKAVPIGDPNASTLQKFFGDSAAVCRVAASELTTAREQSAKLAKQPIGQTPVPALDEALPAMRKPFAGVNTQLGGIGDGVDALAGSTAKTVVEAVRDASRGLSGTIHQIRDQAARAMAAIDDLPRLPMVSVARVLKSTSAAIVIAPPSPASERTESQGRSRVGVTGVDIASLFPPKLPPGATPQAQPDMRAKTEELLMSAIIAVTQHDAPIVVLVHATPVRLGPDFSLFKGIYERLRLAGVDMVEWPVALDPEPPVLTRLDPDHQRPVVYVALPAIADSADAATRMVKLANVLKNLVNGGQSVLFSVNPSTLPTIGQTDPLVEFLEPLGLKVDSARPLLQQFVQPGGRLVSPDLFLTDPKAGQVISGVIRGLTTRLSWCEPLVLEDKVKDVALTPIVTVDNRNKSIWAESEWSDFRRVPPQQRGMVINPPAPDSSRDDTAGPWTIAAAIERARPGEVAKKGTQRLVVVSSNGWFFDDVAEAATVVDGHPTLINPGNCELFEACVLWLAHKDNMIASSPEATAAPLIPNLSDGQMQAIRWGLIAGLPMVILLMGAGWRVLKG